MAEPGEVAAELALRNARRAATLAALCVTVMLVLFLVDAQRNRHMLAQVQEARRILDEFKVVANGAAAQAAPVAGDPPGADEPGGDGADRVGEPPPAGAGVDTAGGNGQAAQGAGRAGMAGGPRGNG